MVKRSSKRDIKQSGAKGGPATGGGLNFQVEYAILNTLDAISRALGDPLVHPTVAMEPRYITENAITSWDVSLSHPDVAVEAKLDPKKEDILAWLDRVEIGALKDLSANTSFFAAN